ncbi:MAG: oligosaccharide flippase family protein [Pseudomonadota bacterium]
MSFIRSAAVTSAASLVSMLLGAVTAKIIAVMAGPSGIAVFSQLRQAGQFVTLFATLNGQNSLVRGIAAREGKSRHDYAFTIGAVFLLGVALVGCAFLLLAPQAGELLFPDGAPALRQTVYLVAPLALLGALASYYQGVLNGLRLIQALALSQVGAAVAAALVAYPCIEANHPAGYVVIVATGFATSVLLSARALRREGWRVGGLLPPGALGTGWDNSAMREHLPFAAVTLVTGLSGAAMVIAIRTLYIHEGGLELGGIFDAVWTISMMYVMLLLSSFGAHYLPTLSGAKTPEDIQHSVSSVFRVAALFGTPLVCTAIVFKPWLVRLLYSQDFASAVELLRWTMLGDYLKISGWVFGMLLIARAERRLFALSELAWQITVLGAVALFLHHSHETAGMAYLAANAAYLLFAWQHARHDHGVRIDAQSFQIWLAGLAMVSLLSLLAWQDRTAPSPGALAVYAVLLPAFFFLATTREQRAWLVASLRKLATPGPEARGGGD